MLQNKNTWQLLLGIVGLLVLVAAGYLTVEGLSSLSDIDQRLATLADHFKAAPASAAGAQPEGAQQDASKPPEEADTGGNAAPIVSSTTPASDASDVAVDSNVTITFSKEVIVAEGWFTITCDTSGDHTAEVSGESASYTLDPEPSFSPGESCTVKVIADKVADKADAATKMESDHSFSFATVAASSTDAPEDASPTVSSTTPGGDSSNVAVGSNITITFDQEVTLTEGWFEIACDTSGDHTAEVSGEGASYTLNPEPDFSPSESCTVKVIGDKVAGTADASRTMESDLSFSFATAAEVDEDEESIKVLLPVADNVLRLSKQHPEIQIRLENTVSATPTVTIENVQIRLLVPRRLSVTATEPLSPSYAIILTESYTLGAESGVNVTLRFDEANLPPTGQYEAWLVVTSDNAKPTSRVLTLEVVSDPQDKPGEASLSFVYPNGGSLVVSDAGGPPRSVRIGLKNLQQASALHISGIELLLLKKKDSAKPEALTPGRVAHAKAAPSAESPLEIASGEVEYVTLTFEDLPVSGQYEAWLVATPEKARPLVEKVTIDVVSFASEPTEASVKVRLPSETANALVLSHHFPKVQVRLENLESVTLAVTVQLIVAAKKEGSDSKPLSPGYASALSDNIQLDPNTATNVNLSFEANKIPPSGQYEAWLLVTGDQGRLLVETLDLTVSAEPLDAFRHRLTGVQDPTIVIGGIRCWPKWLDWPLSRAFQWEGLAWTGVCQDEKEKTVQNQRWDRYELALWEENRRAKQFALMYSELVNDANGHSGMLVVNGPSSSLPDQVITATLKVKDVETPGEYKGILTVVAPDGTQDETISVVVRLRDALWQPFVVIAVGACILGWLLRNTLGDTSRNISFQQHWLVRLRRRLELTGVPDSNPAVVRIEEHLRDAEAALAVQDLDDAESSLRKAAEELEKLESVKALLDFAEQKLSARAAVREARGYFDAGKVQEAEKKLDALLEEEGRPETTKPAAPVIKVKHLGRKDYYEPAEPVPLYTREKVYFRSWQLEGLKWTLRRKCLGRRLWDKASGLTKDTVQFTFGCPGRYELKRGPKTLQLQVEKNPVSVSLKRVRQRAGWANLIWAGVAGVAGLVYINAYVPSFGSPKDYLLALAWGLGLSTAALPTESVIAKLQEAWTKLGKPTQTALPNADVLTGKTGDQIKGILEGLGFKNVRFAPQGVDPKTATYKDMDPKPGTKAKPDRSITVTLTPAPQDSTAQTKMVPLPGEQDLAEQTGDIVQKMLNEAGFTNIKWNPREAKDKLDKYIYQTMNPKNEAEQGAEIIVTLQLVQGDSEQPATKLPLPQEDKLRCQTGDIVQEMLNQAGFTNINWVPEDAKDQLDEYVYQTMEPKTEAEQDAEITVTLQPKGNRGGGDEVVKGSSGRS